MGKLEEAKQRQTKSIETRIETRRLFVKNYTYFPNDFLDNVHLFSSSEVKIISFAIFSGVRPFGYNDLQCKTGISKSTVYEVVGALCERKILLISNNPTPSQIKNLCASLIFPNITIGKVNKENLNDLAVNFPACAWCDCFSAKMQQHHYPIAKADGGTDTVSICPNCHSSYHALIDEKRFIIKPEWHYSGEYKYELE